MEISSAIFSYCVAISNCLYIFPRTYFLEKSTRSYQIFTHGNLAHFQISFLTEMEISSAIFSYCVAISNCLYIFPRTYFLEKGTRSYQIFTHSGNYLAHFQISFLTEMEISSAIFSYCVAISNCLYIFPRTYFLEKSTRSYQIFTHGNLAHFQISFLTEMEISSAIFSYCVAISNCLYIFPRTYFLEKGTRSYQIFTHSGNYLAHFQISFLTEMEISSAIFSYCVAIFNC